MKSALIMGAEMGDKSFNKNERASNRETLSGIPVKEVYGPEDVKNKELGMAGEPPYLRGAYEGMYTRQPWRIFMLTGAGDVEEARARVEYALAQGETGFAAETDMSTWLFFDVDHPEVMKRKQDVGWFGAPVMSLNDYRDYYGSLPLGRLYCHTGAVLPHMTPYFMSCFLRVLEEKGIPANKVNSTGQGDFFIAYISILDPSLIPPSAGLKLNCDGIEYAVKHVPRLTPVSIAGNNIRECGANSYQEMAAILSCAVSYIEELLGRNLKIDDFAYAIGGVNLSTGSDFFEDICKFRAMRRMWYNLLRRYGAREQKSLRLRIHGLPLGSIYTFQQPLNNIVRGTYTVLAAVLGGAQSIGTPSFDEAICTPTQLAHTTALRTQQILMNESNVTCTVDPLGGSYFIEALTDEIEGKAWDYFNKIQDRGGFISCLESGWIQNEVAESSMKSARQIESGKRKIVGVNCFEMDEEPYKFGPFKPNPRTWELSMASLERLRKDRDQVRVEGAKKELRKSIRNKENTMPATLEAVRSGLTVGEVGDIYRELYGRWGVPSMAGLKS
ncbi:MAG: acyl-CoA mutase large subunit family protein [Syntrophales bacterium]|nr:acyl-CoA mutase large subunit family protein [Syntrophales bacterium]